MGKLSKIAPIRPIELPGGFTLAEKGLEVRGFPSFEQYQAAGMFIERAHAASGWWLADWIAYGDSRPDWKAEVDQAVDNGDIAPGTRRQYKYIAKAFPPSNRIDGVPFGHHAVVVNVEPVLRKQLLTSAMQHNWSQRELSHAAKQAQGKASATIVSGQAAEVYEVEATLEVTIEADTPNLAEQRTWDAIKALLVEAGLPEKILRWRVLQTRTRPKLDESK